VHRIFISLTEKQNMQQEKQVQFLCVARPSEVGGWEAFSLDFDIAVQGMTFDEAKDRIQHAIVTYVQDAMKEAEPHKSRLLNRRAPLWVRLMWGWRFFLETVRDTRDHGKNIAVGFPVTCPA
jgi:predicted RNase H-like HicB family nuclease